MKSIPHGLRSLLIRLGIFLILFIITTGIAGPWVVTSKLLYGYHFFIYGNIGKMVILGSVLFLFLCRKKFISLPYYIYPKWNALFLLGGFACIPLFFSLANSLLQTTSPYQNIPLLVSTHVVLLVMPLFLLLGSLGIPMVMGILKTGKKEILTCILIGAILYVSVFQVWKLWPYLSAIVLAAVSFLFSLTFKDVYVFPPLILQVQDFAVRIEQACSGLDSLFLFSGLYWAIGLFEWKHVSKKKLILMYFPAAMGLFIMNIFRVYLIILVGVVYSPELAISLFHTYAGMIFFILYFAIFMKLFYKWMKKP
jgi:exosortase/archaeosortase family protein